jgi:sugar (pentulose or hexulose) kinase
LLVKKRLDPENEIRELRLGGGGTANLPWMQVMADVLDLPISLAQNPEMGIIGAASLARHGMSGQLLESSRCIMRGAKIIEPITANVAIYKEVAERYFDVRNSLREPLLARQGLSPLRNRAPESETRILPLVRDVPQEIR